MSDKLYLVSRRSPFSARSIEILFLSSLTCNATFIIDFILICSIPLSCPSVIFDCQISVCIKAALSPPYLPLLRSFYMKLKVTLSRLERKNSLWELIKRLMQKKKKKSKMSKDAFPKIRLCTVVKIQSGISPVSYAPAEESTGQ